MAECGAMKENMPLLLTESLTSAQREQTHQHIESCVACTAEWLGMREAWRMMEDLPEVPVPPRVKARFLEAAGIAEKPAAKVIPFRARPAVKWVAQAAAVAILVVGGYFAGNRTQPVTLQERPATLSGIQAVGYTPGNPLSIAESRTLQADSVSPDIEGRPDIANVQFTDPDASDGQIGISFDITSRWTVNGSPKDRSMVRLLSYVLENQDTSSPRSEAIEWVRRTYSNPQNANPEIAQALAKVLRSSDSHEGVRIHAVDTLSNLPTAGSTGTREALIEALKSDPNPAVRMKAVEALAALARSGAHLDSATVDTLRQKASQNDENLYVRVKAAEALSNIKP
ncbi:MAG TPA: HEAT repeat domain-containing protein [Thermoanaerobaculia bacterium]|jgi:hypothetical protein